MTVDNSIIIGILALQGAFIEHINHFQQAATDLNNELSDSSINYNFKFIEIRTEIELNSCNALVIPGGESTTISLIATRLNLITPLMNFINDNKPIWGTCAGLIFLSKQIINGKIGQKILGGLNIQVKRNAFGRQLDSFEQILDFSSFIPGLIKFPTIFIRAPVISKILDQQQQQQQPSEQTETETSIIYSENNYINDKPVEILHKLNNGLIVAVRQGNKLGTSFHPELSNDTRFHKWFLTEFVIKSIE